MFCHNNYIKYGWGNQLYGVRQNDSDKFWFKFGACTQEPMSFRDECIRAAKLLYEGTEKKILVHFSGGIDSEIICRSFLLLNIPFEVCIWKYEANLNAHDIVYAIKFCKEYNIKYKFFEIELIDSILYDKYRHNKYHVPFYSLTIRKKAIENNSGYQIMGNGHVFLINDPLNKKNKYFKPMSLLIKDSIINEIYEPKTYAIISEQKHVNHIDEFNKEGTSNFFYYTPELLASFFQDDLVDNCDFKKLKKNIQYKHWPEMEIRPKYTGADLFEKTLIKRHIEKVSKEFPYGKPGNEIIFKDLLEFKNELNKEE